MINPAINKYAVSAAANNGNCFPDVVIDSFADKITPLKISENIKNTPVSRFQEPEISLTESKALIIKALENFSPDLAEKANEILNDPDRLNIRNVEPGHGFMMRLRPAGLIKEDAMDISQSSLPDDIKAEIRKHYPDDANELGENGKGQKAVIDYDYDGSVRSTIYLAHELGHAIADDYQHDSQHTYRDNPSHMEETQAYLVQNIVNHYLNDAANTSDPNLSAAARRSFVFDMTDNIQDMALSLAAMDSLKSYQEGQPFDADTILANRFGENGADQAVPQKMIESITTLQVRDNDQQDKAAAVDFLENQLGRIHGRSTGLLTASGIAAQLLEVDHDTRKDASEALLGRQGPLNIYEVADKAGIKSRKDMQHLAHQVIQHVTQNDQEPEEKAEIAAIAASKFQAKIQKQRHNALPKPSVPNTEPDQAPVTTAAQITKPTSNRRNRTLKAPSM